MTDTTLAPVPVLADTKTGDHDRFAHYVIPPAAVTEAMVTGTPCTAICGKVWVPSRKPEDFPTCPECSAIVEAAWGLNS